MSDEKIIEEIDAEYKKAFPRDFYLWSERGFWIFALQGALKKQREALPSVKEISKIIMESRIKDLYVPEAHDYENDRIAKKLHERIIK